MSNQTYLCRYHPQLTYSQRQAAIDLSSLSESELRHGMIRPCIAEAALGLREMRGQS